MVIEPKAGHLFTYLKCQEEGGKDHVSRVAGLAKHLVDLGGDARREVEGVQHEVADQDEVEDALELLARHQDGDRHRVGWKKKRKVWIEDPFYFPVSTLINLTLRTYRGFQRWQTCSGGRDRIPCPDH